MHWKSFATVRSFYWSGCQISSESPLILFDCTESKIAEKIEISLGSYEGVVPSSFDQCASICHLGYITLDSNEISGFQSREQKRVPIDKQADFVQLVLRGCRKNPLNTHNQVGIAGVRVMGHSKNNAAHSINHVPLTMFMAPTVTSVLTLPSSLKNELDTKTQTTLDRLERLKKERAISEDFEMAAKIKESLSSVYSLLTTFKESEKNMYKSAVNEDYASAARLKSERDLKRVQAMLALEEVERQFLGRSDEMAGDPILNDMSLASHSMKNFSPQRVDDIESSTIASHIKSGKASEEESHNKCSCVGGIHPLLGVQDAEELPAPEELSNNGAFSSDFVQKCEEILGCYRTKCFFSKNWMLREAALAKITLLVPDLIRSNTTDIVAELMFNIVEVSIDDKNLQVYLAALVLLDELILQIELTEPSHAGIASHVSRIASNLLSKLADLKQKIVDSAELGLLCMASSYSIDHSPITKAATKRIRSKESKGGRTIKARLRFLDNLAVEFGSDVEWKRIVHFVVKSSSFDHREEGVRDAAKSLIVTLMAVSDLFTLSEKTRSM